MKSLALSVLMLFSFSAFAFQDGSYICGSNANGETSYSYKIKSLTIDGSSIPLLEVTTTTRDESHTIKGIATQFTNSQGGEFLVLGNITLQLKSGRPNCNPAL